MGFMKKIDSEIIDKLFNQAKDSDKKSTLSSTSIL